MLQFTRRVVQQLANEAIVGISLKDHHLTPVNGKLDKQLDMNKKKSSKFARRCLA
jgi:hypothetical protein